MDIPKIPSEYKQTRLTYEFLDTEYLGSLYDYTISNICHNMSGYGLKESINSASNISNEVIFRKSENRQQIKHISHDIRLHDGNEHVKSASRGKLGDFQVNNGVQLGYISFR